MRDTAICALLFGGDACRLYHARCLDTLQRLSENQRCELRIGCNSVTAQATLDQIRQLGRRLGERLALVEGDNIWKYPRMREMFRAKPLPTHVMWWDDDSYLDTNIKRAGAWLDAVCADAAPDAQLGFLARWAWRGKQRATVMSAPWYAGRAPLEEPGRSGALCAKFITGGWWVAPGALLGNWPPVDMIHQGGDVMLSQMLHQRGCRLVQWSSGVFINADARGVSHAAPTRGRPSVPAYGVTSCPSNS